jgi:hypothetical protein
MTDSEIAELMAMKSKHGAGGEYSQAWMPKVHKLYLVSAPAGRMADIVRQPEDQPPALPAPEEVPPEGEAAIPAPARPAWRVVHKRKERPPKQITNGTPASPRAAPVPVPATPAPAPPPNLPAWAQWRRTSWHAHHVVAERYADSFI